MTSIMKKVCFSLGIRLDGYARNMATHGLQASIISYPVSHGYSDAAVRLRTGHRDPSNL